MNIIDAIINLINNPVYHLKETYVNERNRANSAGDALEEYVKDLFAGTTNEIDKEKRIQKYNEVFSYLGNNSNPPDIILKNGDAIEVKKIESLKSALALNSSYPKHKLYSTNPLINKACRECEYISETEDYWVEKDMIYAVGTIDKIERDLKRLIFIYGEDYAADVDVYENVKNKIKDGVTQIEGVVFTPTKELGKVKKVDPLGATDLRIRGMWHISNPLNVFEEIFDEDDANNKFNFTAIVNQEKWDSFSNTKELEDLVKSTQNADIVKKQIQDSNNPAKLKDVVIVKFNE